MITRSWLPIKPNFRYKVKVNQFVHKRKGSHTRTPRFDWKDNRLSYAIQPATDALPREMLGRVPYQLCLHPPGALRRNMIVSTTRAEGLIDPELSLLKKQLHIQYRLAYTRLKRGRAQWTEDFKAEKTRLRARLGQKVQKHEVFWRVEIHETGSRSTKELRHLLSRAGFSGPMLVAWLEDTLDARSRSRYGQPNSYPVKDYTFIEYDRNPMSRSQYNKLMAREWTVVPAKGLDPADFDWSSVRFRFVKRTRTLSQRELTTRSGRLRYSKIERLRKLADWISDHPKPKDWREYADMDKINELERKIESKLVYTQCAQYHWDLTDSDYWSGSHPAVIHDHVVDIAMAQYIVDQGYTRLYSPAMPHAPLPFFIRDVYIGHQSPDIPSGDLKTIFSSGSSYLEGLRPAQDAVPIPHDWVSSLKRCSGVLPEGGINLPVRDDTARDWDLLTGQAVSHRLTRMRDVDIDPNDGFCLGRSIGELKDLGISPGDIKSGNALNGRAFLRSLRSVRGGFWGRAFKHALIAFCLENGLPKDKSELMDVVSCDHRQEVWTREAQLARARAAFEREPILRGAGIVHTPADKLRHVPMARDPRQQLLRQWEGEVDLHRQRSYRFAAQRWLKGKSMFDALRRASLGDITAISIKACAILYLIEKFVVTPTTQDINTVLKSAYDDLLAGRRALRRIVSSTFDIEPRTFKLGLGDLRGFLNEKTFDEPLSPEQLPTRRFPYINPYFFNTETGVVETRFDPLAPTLMPKSGTEWYSSVPNYAALAHFGAERGDEWWQQFHDAELLSLIRDPSGLSQVINISGRIRGLSRSSCVFTRLQPEDIAALARDAETGWAMFQRTFSPIFTTWELAPLSFVVDWVLTTGQVVQYLQRTMDRQLRWYFRDNRDFETWLSIKTIVDFWIGAPDVSVTRDIRFGDPYKDGNIPSEEIQTIARGGGWDNKLTWSPSEATWYCMKQDLSTGPKWTESNYDLMRTVTNCVLNQAEMSEFWLRYEEETHGTGNCLARGSLINYGTVDVTWKTHETRHFSYCGTADSYQRGPCEGNPLVSLLPLLKLNIDRSKAKTLAAMLVSAYL